jgi:hypothetical protein
MEKIYFKEQLKHLYRPYARKVEIITVPQMNFLMVDGKGDPSTSQSFSDVTPKDFEDHTLRSISHNTDGG